MFFLLGISSQDHCPLTFPTGDVIDMQADCHEGALGWRIVSTYRHCPCVDCAESPNELLLNNISCV